MDCTGSMSEWITQCKENIVEIVETTKLMFSKKDIEVGFVGY
jgi:hypothetical protein